MENSLLNKIAVWRNEGRPHEYALEIIKYLEEAKMVPSYFIKVVRTESPFSSKKIEECFERVEKEFLPKKEKKIPKLEDLPMELHSIRNDLIDNYERISQLRGELRTLFYTKKGTPRKTINRKSTADISLTIVHLSLQNINHLNTLDDYTENGRIPAAKKTDPMSELKRAAKLLQLQPEAINYIRKQNTYKKRNGSIQNPELYRERANVISEIRKFIEQHGGE